MERHPMLNEGEQYDLEFDDIKHGRLILSAGKNPLNNLWMWWWDKTHSMYAGSKQDISGIVKNTRKRAIKTYTDTFWGIKG